MPTILNNLGRLLQCKGNDGDAVALFRRAAARMPDFALIFNNLALSLDRLGQADEALLAKPWLKAETQPHAPFLRQRRATKEAVELGMNSIAAPSAPPTP